MRSGQRFSYLALEPEETRALNEDYHQSIHRDQSDGKKLIDLCHDLNRDPIFGVEFDRLKKLSPGMRPTGSLGR
jgi:hypothetical protein